MWVFLHRRLNFCYLNHGLLSLIHLSSVARGRLASSLEKRIFRRSRSQKYTTPTLSVITIEYQLVFRSTCEKQTAHSQPFPVASQQSVAITSFPPPRLLNQVPDLPRLDFRELSVQGPLRLEVEETLLEKKPKHRAHALQHLLGEVGVHGWVRRKLGDLARPQGIQGVVRGLELGTRGPLGDGQELVQGELVADDVRLLVPRRRLGEEEGGDEPADVEAVGEDDWDVAGTGDRGRLVGDVDGQGEAAEVGLDVRHDVVVQEETVDHGRVFERGRLEGIQALYLALGDGEDGGDSDVSPWSVTVRHNRTRRSRHSLGCVFDPPHARDVAFGHWRHVGSLDECQLRAYAKGRPEGGDDGIDPVFFEGANDGGDVVIVDGEHLCTELVRFGLIGL
jgi:hypothetical protein